MRQIFVSNSINLMHILTAIDQDISEAEFIIDAELGEGKSSFIEMNEGLGHDWMVLRVQDCKGRLYLCPIHHLNCVFFHGFFIFN